MLLLYPGAGTPTLQSEREAVEMKELRTSSMRSPWDDSLYHHPHFQWLFAYYSPLCPGAGTRLRVRGRRWIEAKEVRKEQEVETDDLRMIVCTITLTLSDYLLIILLFILEQEPISSEWEGGGGGQGDTEGAGGGDRWPQDDSLYHHPHSQWLFACYSPLCHGAGTRLLGVRGRRWRPRRYGTSRRWRQMTSGRLFVPSPSLSVIICWLFSSLS